MRRIEITFRSVNTVHYSKPVTACVVVPQAVGRHTGVLLISHGWGGNRLDYLPTMEYAADAFDLVCLSVEFRGSGYDFDPVAGRGAVNPYDAGFLQVFDVLAGLRAVLDLFGGLDRGRIFHYGGSQGGHLALLSGVYAPSTFAALYATSAVVFIGPEQAGWAGRAFAPHEEAARNALALADRILCPVWIEHGTADATVPCDAHTRALGRRLAALGREFTEIYHEGGDHGLAPATTRLDSFKRLMDRPLRELRNPRADDFRSGSLVRIPCGAKVLRIDWSKPSDSVELCRFDDA